MRLHLRVVPLVALLLVGAVGACGTGDGGDGGGGDDSKAQVAAAFYPLAWAAEQVAGDHATVENLTSAGGEPHDLELSIQQTVSISEADLVVLEHGFQPAVDAAVEENASGEVLDAAEAVELRPAPEHDHGGHGDHEGHEHDGDDGDLDPHFWMDPLLMADLGDALAASLAEVDPEHAGAYEQNAAALRADLERLDQRYAEGLATCERDTVVVSHDAFGYLARYGIHMEPIAGLSPGAEPTPAALARLQQLIRSEGITTVFSERLASPRMAETLASDTGVTTDVLDPVEGLSEETADSDYRDLMVSNLEALRRANGC